MRRLLSLTVCLFGMLSVAELWACDLCPQQGPALSIRIDQSAVVVFGPTTNARLAPDGFNGTSDLKVETVLKGADALKDQPVLKLNSFVPPDPKVRFLVFVDVQKGQFDAYYALPLTSDRMVKYLQEAPPALKRDAKPEAQAERLKYYFRFLNDADPDIAGDAFKEWAASSNRAVSLVAPGLAPEELRKWLLDPKTPPHRLSLFAYLLGACGTDRDAELLRSYILNPDDRIGNAMDGLLAGYSQIRPKDGWKLTEEVIADAKRPFTQRHAILRMLRFAYGANPEQTRGSVLRCSGLMLGQPDLQDLATNTLTFWKLWDHTDQVLAFHGTKAWSVPMTRRAVVRYALACPLPKSKQFVATLRAKEPKLVEEVEDFLDMESGK